MQQPERRSDPARSGKWRAGPAGWLPTIANLAHTFTFGVPDQAILTRSLIADIALPVLVLAHIPAFFSPPRRTAAESSRLSVRTY